jgi:hypothetical protein
MQYVVPHAPGFCILVRREVHEAIGGFDETLVLAEDHDYVQRAAQLGKFRVLQSAPMPTSMRRVEKEGLVGLAFKYVYSEVFVITGQPIKKVPFEYELLRSIGRRGAVKIGLDKVREACVLGEPLERRPNATSSPAFRSGRPRADSIEMLLHDLTPTKSGAARLRGARIELA